MDREPGQEELLAVAVESARRAGHHALREVNRRREAVARTQHDVKLKLDLECQHLALEVIARSFPAHRVLAEEEGPAALSGAKDCAYEWIVDPIDGTVNFSHGLPFWCCSVAVRRRSRFLAAAVFAPMLNEWYTATLDGPAKRGNVPLHVSDLACLGEAVILTGLDKLAEPATPPYAFFRRIAEAVQRPRILGSAAMDLCRVAAGEADGYFETGIFIWDVAAAGLIVERAGGRIETLKRSSGHRLSFLATNGRIHNALRTVLSGASPESVAS